MKRGILIVLIMVFVSGCNGNGGASEKWDYKEGYIISKEDQKVLVIRHVNKDNEKSIAQVLKENSPDAIWITLKNVDQIDSLSVGDKVKINIDGVIEQSYPAQAKAKVTKVSK